MSERETIDGWMAEAARLHQAGKLAEAAGLYRRIVAAYPGETEAAHFLGISLHQMGEDAEGLAWINDSIRKEPGRVDWLNNLGNVLTKLRRLDEAEQAFTRALEIQPRHDGLLANLGAVLQRQKRYAGAEAFYLRALEANPRNLEVLNLLASLAAEQGRRIEAARFHARALIASPGADRFPFELGKAHLILDQVEAAAAVYRRWLDAEPENPTAAHLYAACSRREVPERCSAAYVEKTFDAFAPLFEEKLGELSYRGPELIGETLRRIVPAGAALEILDACCGTGLCGPVLKPLAATLTGVDLSQGMLEQAGRRALYDGLVKAELEAYLQAHPTRFDLIACADALIYFGRLEPVFAGVAASLRPGGVFLFTIEIAIGAPDDYQLHATGRYRHTLEYVTRLVEESGLDMLEVKQGPLRMELGDPVGAWVIAARKRPGAGA